MTAQSGNMVVQLQDIEGNDGTVRNALEMLVATRGPLAYNAWQSAYFALLRDYRLRDAEAPEPETRTQRAERIKLMYATVHEEIHGQNYLRTVVQMMSRARAGASLEQDSGGAAVLPEGEAHAEQIPIQDMDEEQAALVTNLEVERFNISDTPRSGRSEPTSVQSPDRVFERGNAAAVWENDWATHTEDSEELHTRLDDLVTNLATQDTTVTGSELEFVIAVEQLLPGFFAIYQRWVAQDPVNRSSVDVKVFALSLIHI